MQLARHKAFSSASTKCHNSRSRGQRVTCRAQLREQQQQQQSHRVGDLLKRTGAAALSGAVALSLLVSGELLLSLTQPVGLASKQLSSSNEAVSLALPAAGPAAARLEGVNRPELLPKEPNVPVIDVAGFLTASEVSGRVILQQFLGVTQASCPPANAGMWGEGSGPAAAAASSSRNMWAAVAQVLGSSCQTASMLLSATRPAFSPERKCHKQLSTLLPCFPTHHTTRLLLQEKRLVAEVTDLEADTGVRVRVLAQNYPETPGVGVCVGGWVGWELAAV